MENCEHGVNNLKFIPRINKDVCLAGARLNFWRLRGSIFERPNGGRADCDDSPIRKPCTIDCRRSFSGNFEVFAMQFVIFDAVHFYWLKRSQAHMQSKFGGFDS